MIKIEKRIKILFNKIQGIYKKIIKTVKTYKKIQELIIKIYKIKLKLLIKIYKK